MLALLGAISILFAYFVGSLLAAVLIRALVLQILWSWFVIEQFGLAPLSLYMAAGLITVTMALQGISDTAAAGWKLRCPDNSDDDDGDDKTWDQRTATMRKSLGTLAVTHVLFPLALLAVGWIIIQGL